MATDPDWIPNLVDDPSRFSAGLLSLALGVVILSMLVGIVTYVAFELSVRYRVNKRTYLMWLEPLLSPIQISPIQDDVRAAFHMVMEKVRTDPEVDPLDQLKLPNHVYALHPQRLSAQISNRLQMIASVDPSRILALLKAADGLPQFGESEQPPTLTGKKMSEQEKADFEAFRDAFRRRLAARIDGLTDEIQSRLMRANVLARYSVAAVTSAALCLIVFVGFDISPRLSYIAFVFFVGLLSAMIAALAVEWADRPAIV